MGATLAHRTLERQGTRLERRTWQPRSFGAITPAGGTNPLRAATQLTSQCTARGIHARATSGTSSGSPRSARVWSHLASIGATATAVSQDTMVLSTMGNLSAEDKKQKG